VATYHQKKKKIKIKIKREGKGKKRWWCGTYAAAYPGIFFAKAKRRRPRFLVGYNLVQ
jgi:hypothetical protein